MVCLSSHTPMTGNMQLADRKLLTQDPDADIGWHHPTHSGEVPEPIARSWICYAEPWSPQLSATLLYQDIDFGDADARSMAEHYATRNRLTFGVDVERSEAEGGRTHPKSRRLGQRRGLD